MDAGAPIERAIALEFDVRGWAIGLAEQPSATSARDSGLSAALGSKDWRARLAGLDAIGRAAANLRGLESEAWARKQIRRGLGDVHPNVQVAALEAMDAFGGVWEVEGVPWTALGAAEMPEVRLGLAKLLMHGLASQDPALASLWSAEERAESGRLLEVRLGLFLGEQGAGLLSDDDDEVRGTSRQSLMIAELPEDEELGAAIRRERLELLYGLVQEHRIGELCILLQVLARTTPDVLFLDALSDWAGWIATEHSAELLNMGLLPRHFRGLVEATRATAGGGCDTGLLVPAFANWVLLRADSTLEFDAWRAVDDLFTSGVRAGGEELATCLIKTAGQADFGLGALDAFMPDRAQGLPVQGDEEEVRRELFQALVDSNEPAQVLSLGALHVGTDALAKILVDQFSGGFDAAHLGDARKWAALEKKQRDLPLAVVEAVSTHHTFHPSSESEQFLLEVMKWADYASLETAFKALCDARWSDAERFGLCSDKELFEGLFTGFDSIWKMSRGVRLDILVKLPHVKEVARFAPLIAEVGDIAGPSAGYRGQCVELLGSCVGSEIAADALQRWLQEELDAAELEGSEGPLTRAQELELSGFARAFAGVGARRGAPARLAEDGQTLDSPRELGRGPLEKLLQLSRGRSDELGKHAVAAMAKFDGGLESIADLYLDETGAIDQRARIEAGVLCIQGGVQTEAALAELIRDYGGIGWDLRDRVVRAIGYSPGEESLQFLLGLVEDGLEEHNGLVTREELNSAIDVLAWRSAMGAAEEREGNLDVAFEALTRVARFASNLESRGMGISRIGSLLAELRSAGVLWGESGDAAYACLEKFAETREPFVGLAADEVSYLMDKATLALAESLGGTRQPEWLQERVLEGPLLVGREDLVERWRGVDPGEREFTNRGSVDLWRALGDVSAVIDGVRSGEWYGADGRLLATMAHMIESEEPSLAARLYTGAVVGLEGEPKLDRDAWTIAVGRQMGLAWRSGDWRLASNLCERLVVARRRGALPTPAFRAVFGLRSAGLGVWPVARLESMRIQARARLAGERGALREAGALAARAGELVGASRAGNADQEALAR